MKKVKLGDWFTKDHSVYVKTGIKKDGSRSWLFSTDCISKSRQVAKEHNQLVALKSVLTDEIIWTGDFYDDCTCTVGKLFGRAEALDDNCWYCALYRELPDGRAEQLFHNAEENFHPTSGEQARKMIEKLIRLEAAKQILNGAN